MKKENLSLFLFKKFISNTTKNIKAAKMADQSNSERPRVESFESIDFVESETPTTVHLEDAVKISGRGWGRVRKFLLCKTPFPRSIYFIVGNEFCERFSYYGMKAILFIYLSRELGISKDNATALFHGFSMLCYFTPLFGAMLADGWIGKYRTILYISIIYALGNAIVSLTALPPLGMGELPGPMIGLLLIAIGTGGIKPCVSAFGGDQFTTDQEHLLQSFFSVFYFAINAGSLLSMLLTPVLRGDVKCFGKDCYSLAFGVPALLMVIAILLFWAGRHGYKRKPPSGNIVWLVTKATCHAIKRKFTHKDGVCKNHWIDWADDLYDEQLIDDIKALYRVLFMFLPLPFFWTLFDQQGSRWVQQATLMDGSIGALGTIKPDQMQALNAVFIIILIPVFEGIIYKVFIKPSPLKRMSIGMLLASLAFVVAGLVQLKVQASQDSPGLPPGKTNIQFTNAINSKTFVSFNNRNITILPLGKSNRFELDSPAVFNVTVFAPCAQKQFQVKLTKEHSYDLAIGCYSNQIMWVSFARENLNDPVPSSSSSLCVVVNPNLGEVQGRFLSAFMNGRAIWTNVSSANLSNRTRCTMIPAKDYTLEMKNEKGRLLGRNRVSLQGGVRYTCVLLGSYNGNDGGIFMYKDVKNKTVSMLWQIPQYFIITSGEILFSITGLEFAYSQAPASMKSCLQAAWLLTVAFGNLVVVVEAESHVFKDLSTEFFFFAAMLGVVMGVFVVMSLFYKYVEVKSEPQDDNVGIVTMDELQSI